MSATARRFVTEALVIRHMDYGEADQILTLYTPDRGKLHVIAKGVRRSKSRSGGHLDLFSRCSVLIHQGRNLGIVSQPHLLEQFDGLRTDLQAVGSAHYVCELLDAFVPDSLANEDIYQLTVSTLRWLASTPHQILIRIFELALLDASGYRPELHHCLGCGSEIGPGDNRFSGAAGGILCPLCLHQDASAVPVNDQALKLLRNLQRSPDSVLRLESVDQRVAVEVEARLREYITYRLEKRPKSVAVLDRMALELERISAPASSPGMSEQEMTGGHP